jgi:protease I
MSENTSDLELITQTVEHYFQGMYHSDTERLKKAFHPEAYLFGHFQGAFTHASANDWFEMVKQRPAPATNGEPYDMRIVSIDLTGEVAVVKVADLYMDLRFTDYLTLLKVDGEWLIVNKTFHHD